MYIPRCSLPYLNSRSPVGSDAARYSKKIADNLFKLTLPCGERQCIEENQNTRLGNLNSRSPVGSDDLKKVMFLQIKDLNSRSPVGSDKFLPDHEGGTETI